MPHKTLFEDGKGSGGIGFREIKVLTQDCHKGAGHRAELAATCDPWPVTKV